jgi:UDP-N-acetylglucosamine 2-epimerase
MAPNLPKIICVVGTRPEAIKMAPVVLELRRYRHMVDTLLVSTGQHREMLTQALATFDLQPDVDLAIMQSGQTLAQVTSRAMEGLDAVLEREKPNVVIGQGDTTTCFVASLGAFYRQIPFAHVEAGLRTDTVTNPFPEEFNRRATGLISAMHFPPTSWAADNLLNEGHDPFTVLVTGNTCIDAVLSVAARAMTTEWNFQDSRVVLLTTHRRENWGEPQRRIARAARRLIEAYPDTLLVVPMHRNPVVREVLESELNHPRVRLIEPPEYAEFVHLMKLSHLILTDSGGVQEEAPSLGVPVLVLRETTERPEGVTAGTARLVGTEEEAIYSAADQLLSDASAYTEMAKAASPYGDGLAAARIRHRVLSFLGVESPKVPSWSLG